MSQITRRIDFSLDVHTLNRQAVHTPVLEGDRMFVFRCPACGKRLRTAASRIGLIGRCPACRHDIPIPARAERT